MINKYKKGVTISPGQYVNFESVFTDGLCSRGGLVTKVSGQRIYFIDQRDETEQFKLLKSVVFVSDSLEENEFLIDCNRKQMTAIRIMEDMVKEAIMEQIYAR